MYFWYKILTYLFYLIAPIYLYIRKLRKKENHERYKEKLSKIILPRGNGFLVWIHVASVGEAMSILPLIDRFVEEKKIDKILITSITISSGRILDKKFKENKKIVHQFLPLDIPVLTSKFLEHWKPNLSVFIDSEIWPNFIFQIKKRNIPLLLVNARITTKTFKRWKVLINFARSIFSKFDLCIASNEESEIYLKFLGAKNIKNHGNLKYSYTKNDLNKKLNPILLDKIKKRKIWCASSTHQGEEILCAKAHLKIKKKYHNILTIIIPRHIDRIQKINSDLSSLNLKVVNYSDLNSFNENSDILLVDSYGETSKFFNISKCVYLGKSLVQSLILDSGQNPIEAARAGCKIFHGPNVSNFVEIYKYLKTLKITEEVNDGNELSLLLVEELQKKESRDAEITTKIENYGQKIFNNVIMELKKYI